MTRRIIDISGQRFGKLLVLHNLPSVLTRRNRWETLWLCRCDCGVEKPLSRKKLVEKGTKSCGCGAVEHNARLAQEAKARRAARLAAKPPKPPKRIRTPEYRAWDSMKQRCYNPKRRDYKNWGGRGIRVCAQWVVSFEHFLADMGSRPTPKHSLDRRDNDGHYTPDNCRWATLQEQMSNQQRHR